MTDYDYRKEMKKRDRRIDDLEFATQNRINELQEKMALIAYLKQLERRLSKYETVNSPHILTLPEWAKIQRQFIEY